MLKPKTLITADISEPYLSRIIEMTDATCEGWVVTAGKILTEEELIDGLKDKEIGIIGVEQVTRRVIEACPELRIIFTIRGNPVNIDRAAASERRIPIVYTPGRNANAVAEFLVGALISMIRKISLSYHEIKNGAYLGETVENVLQPPEKDDIVWGFVYPSGEGFYQKYEGPELFGSTFGMIGYGAIGRRLAKFLKAMDVNVAVYDPYLDARIAEEDGVTLTNMETVLRTSDYVSVHCKVTEETKNLIGEKEFAMMKPTAIFINTARAIIVNQKALLDALVEKKIAGALLDVFWQEPVPANHPLLNMENVLSHHILRD